MVCLFYPHSKGSKGKRETIMTSSTPAGQEAMYEIPSASRQPLPAIPPEEAKEKEEDIMYEVIPGEK